MRGGFCERRWMESMCKASERLPGTHSHFFLTGFRQRTENVTFASYNKGGSVKAVKKRFIGNSAIMQPYPQDVHHSTLL